eukprot:TRINITY_DN4405_c0_g1_i2.p1 TRINITY_DN4405_c0_g1~~TRINITY_DN4405_c0_g1_i2.p1  ORF type:complete len:813 (+),score=144.23 TRINITY_DN4405_c0_g1_i2:883-3321(+)
MPRPGCAGNPPLQRVVLRPAKGSASGRPHAVAWRDGRCDGSRRQHTVGRSQDSAGACCVAVGGRSQSGRAAGSVSPAPLPHAAHAADVAAGAGARAVEGGDGWRRWLKERGQSAHRRQPSAREGQHTGPRCHHRRPRGDVPGHCFAASLRRALAACRASVRRQPRLCAVPARVEGEEACVTPLRERDTHTLDIVARRVPEPASSPPAPLTLLSACCVAAESVADSTPAPTPEPPRRPVPSAAAAERSSPSPSPATSAEASLAGASDRPAPASITLRLEVGVAVAAEVDVLRTATIGEMLTAEPQATALARALDAPRHELCVSEPPLPEDVQVGELWSDGACVPVRCRDATAGRWELSYAEPLPAGAWTTPCKRLRMSLTLAGGVVATAAGESRVRLAECGIDDLPQQLRAPMAEVGSENYIGSPARPSQWRLDVSGGGAVWLRQYGDGESVVVSAVVDLPGKQLMDEVLVARRPALWHSVSLRRPYVTLHHPSVGCTYTVEPPTWGEDGRCEVSVSTETQLFPGVQVLELNPAGQSGRVRGGQSGWWQDVKMRRGAAVTEDTSDSDLLLTLRKEPDDQLGATFDTDTLTLVRVAPGGPAAGGNFGLAIGRQLTEVDGRRVGAWNGIRGLHKGKRVLAMRFGRPPEAVRALRGWWRGAGGDFLHRVSPPFVERFAESGRKSWTWAVESGGGVQLCRALTLRLSRPQRTLADLTSTLGANFTGLTVTGTAPDGLWQRRGLPTGYALQAVGRKVVRDPASVEAALAGAGSNAELLFHGEVRCTRFSGDRVEWEDGTAWDRVVGGLCPFAQPVRVV